MAYEINEAKALVVKAGKELVSSGLIARTWGNVSARISDTQFVITPSGKPYETLTPDDIVVVNIADLEYEGDIKPSSEKGVHADAYALRSEVNFVIHTHQINASVLSPTGRGIKQVPKSAQKVLGETIPCGAYGMPSTDKLRKGVANAVRNNPFSKAVIMKHHGALCMGADYDEAFAVTAALEDVCGKEIAKAMTFRTGKKYSADKLYKAFAKVHGISDKVEPCDLGSSEKVSNTVFKLLMKNGDEFYCNVVSGTALGGIAPRVALIHAAIYQSSDVTFIEQLDSADAVTLSCLGQGMKPHLDDFDQIAGFKVKCENWERSSYRTDAKDIGKALKGQNAVLVKGHGALCTGSSLSDVEAVKLVLEKECKTEMYCNICLCESPLSTLDDVLMRTIYLAKYSKQASK